MWFFSIGIAFLVFGVIANLLCNFDDDVRIARRDDPIFFWLIVSFLSVFWFITVPVCVLVVLVYLLSKLTDVIAQYILRKLNKQKEK